MESPDSPTIGITLFDFNVCVQKVLSENLKEEMGQCSYHLLEAILFIQSRHNSYDTINEEE